MSVNGVDDSVVWGVNSFNSVYRWSGWIWKRVHGNFVHVSCGQPGVWGLNSQNEVFYRTGTYGGTNRFVQYSKKYVPINAFLVLGPVGRKLKVVLSGFPLGLRGKYGA